MITQAQRNAALVAAHAEVLKIVGHMIPPMFSSWAKNYIEANPQLIANVSDACLDAADNVLLLHPSVPPPPPPTVHPIPEATNVQHPST